MPHWLAIVGAVLAVFSVIAIGATLRHVNWLTEEADQSILQLIVRVLVPCFIFHVVLGNEALRQSHNILVPPLVGLGTVLLGFAVALLAARWLGPAINLQSHNHRRTFAFAVGVYNYGYIPIPLLMALYPGDQGTLGVLLVHNIGVELAFWTAGIVLVAGAAATRDGSRGRWWLRLVNPPSLAIVAALLLNALDGRQWLPTFLLATIKMLGDCAIPLGLLLAGATITDLLGTERDQRGPGSEGWGLRVIAAACALRLFLLPAAFIALAMILPVSVELKRVIVIQAAMPAAIFPIIAARHYGGDAPTAVRVALGTSLLSLLTIPVCLKLGLQAVGIN